MTAMTGDILDKLLVILVLRLIEARLNYADNAGKLDIIAVNNAVKQAVTLPTRAVTALHEKNMLRRSPVKRFLQKMRGSMWIMRK